MTAPRERSCRKVSPEPPDPGIQRSRILGGHAAGRVREAEPAATLRAMADRNHRALEHFLGTLHTMSAQLTADAQEARKAYNASDLAHCRSCLYRIGLT